MGEGIAIMGGKCFFLSRIKLDTRTKIVTFAFWVGSCCFMYFWYATKAVFSAPVQIGPGSHSASCTMGTISFPGVKSGRGVTLTPQPLLVPWPWESRAIPLLPLSAVRPVQSLSACTRVTFTLLSIILYTHFFYPTWQCATDQDLLLSLSSILS